MDGVQTFEKREAKRVQGEGVRKRGSGNGAVMATEAKHPHREKAADMSDWIQYECEYYTQPVDFVGSPAYPRGASLTDSS